MPKLRHSRGLPLEQINHEDLLDMPDIAGVNPDHDARYYTETELNSTIAPSGSSLIGIEDVGGFFAGADVEAVLQEIPGIILPGAYLRLDGTNVPTANYNWTTNLLTTGIITATTLQATGLTAGSVVFSDGTNLTQDNFNLFWDDTRKELQPNLIKITNDGSQASPALKFNDTNTGFFKSGNSIRLSINNNTIMTIDGDNDRVGIGTASPSRQLHIAGSGTSSIRLSDTGAGNDTQVNAITEYYRGLATNRVGWMGFGSSSNDNLSMTNQITGGNIILIPTATGKVGIGVADPHSKLEVAGAISSATSTFSTAGPTDNVDVSGINTLFVNTADNNVIIGGFAGGVDGQILYVVRISNVNDLTIEHNEGGATQPILLHKGSDETLDGHFGGWTFVCHGGTDWHDASHAKHV